MIAFLLLALASYLSNKTTYDGTCVSYNIQISFLNLNLVQTVIKNEFLLFFPAPKPVGRRARKPGVDRKPRQAYSSKQLEKLESEFKV